MTTMDASVREFLETTAVQECTTLDTVHAVVNLTALPCFTEHFDCSLEQTQTPSVLTSTYHT